MKVKKKEILTNEGNRYACMLNDFGFLPIVHFLNKRLSTLPSLPKPILNQHLFKEYKMLTHE